MHFFQKFINMEQVERIEWHSKMEIGGFTRNNVSSCILQFQSGKVLTLNRELARELFDYMERNERQAQPTPEEE